MSTSKKILLAGAAIAILVALFLVFRGGGDDTSDAGSDTAAGETTVPTPRRLAAADRESAPSASTPPAVSFDDDPVGPLRLEGLVVDADGIPVAGAVVHLGSNPPRETESGEDGTFVFDSLVGRTYAVYARSANHVGGPIVHLLTADSDPVVIKVRPGASLEVTVVEAGTGTPIAGTEVGLVESESVRATTDERGVALLANVPAGQHVLFTSKAGYADSRQLVALPDTAGVTVRRQIALEPGVMLAGRVVDPDHEPVAGAKVVVRAAGGLFDLVDTRRDGVTTDSEGRFEITGAPIGAVRLSAVHRSFAPTTTETLELAAGQAPGDVEIVLEPGGVVAGKVVDSGGAAVPWATVRVGPDPETSGWGGAEQRQVVADEDGSFRLTGLERIKLIATASSDLASSDLVAVDLAAVPRSESLTLRLDLEGVIAGVVVDEDGEPVIEAQVMALPDFWEGGEMRQLAARGPSYATTDGGGAFTLRGLPDTKFRVRASRSALSGGAIADKGVAAKTGDTDLRVVLPTPGAVEGKIVLADGSTPKLATVSLAWAAGVPADESGRFRVENIPPGNYDLTVRGPGFPDRTVPRIEVEPGATADAGTITLRRGRSIGGRVVDDGGMPVAGATVVAGKQIVSDASKLTAGGLGSAAPWLGTQTTTTDADGGFRFSGVGDDELVVVAEKGDLGRSPAQKIPPGTEDVNLDLVLAAFGSLRGTVTVNGKATSGINLIVSPSSGAKQMIVLESDDAGGFAIARIAGGSYKVNAMAGAMGGAATTSATVDITPGEEATVEIAMEQGNVTFEVVIEGEGGAHIDASQVFLFSGRVTPRTGGELNEIFLSSNSAGSSQMTFAHGAAPARFEKVSAGEYSVCVIPINGDLNDQGFAARLQDNVATLAVHCRVARIAESPAEQSFTATVPPMQPFPEEPEP